jgi:hypothetical protein
MKPAAAKPRFKQFSLRACLLGITTACIVLSIWTYRANTQHSAVIAIRSAGGRVTYLPKTSTSWTPTTWLIDSVGRDFFFGVELVTLYPEKSQTADMQVRLLDGLYGLKKLAIWPGCKERTRGLQSEPGGLTDQGAEYLLENQTSLEHLSLLSARLSDEGCRELSEAIPSLQLGLHPDFAPKLLANLQEPDELSLDEANAPYCGTHGIEPRIDGIDAPLPKLDDPIAPPLLNR